MRHLTLLHTILILAVVIGLSILFYLPYQTVKNRTINSFNKEQLILAKQAAEGMQNVFSLYGKALDYYSSQPSVIEMDEDGRRELGNFYSIHTPDLVSIVRVDQNGQIIYHSPGRKISALTDESEKLLACLTRTDQQPFITDIPSRTHTLVAFTWPVNDKNTYVGNLTFLVSFNKLVSKFLIPLKTVHSRQTWIISRDGIVPDCPNPDHSGAHITKSTKTVENKPQLLTIMQKMIEGGEGAGTFTFLADKIGNEASTWNHVVYMPVTLPGDNFWSIAIATPQEYVLENMQNFRNRWILVTSIAMCVLLVLCYLLSTFITRADEEKKRGVVEDQLIQLINFTPIGIVVYDMQGHLKYANKATLQLFEKDDLQEIVDINVFELIHHESREFVTERFNRVLAGEISEPAIIKVILPGNLEKNIEISTTPFNFGGQPCGITVLQDVSERLKSEEEYRRLATAIENTNDSIVITDVEGMIQYVNPAFTRISGYSKEEAIGRNPRFLKSGHHDNDFYARMWNTILQGKVWEGQVVNRNKDGSFFTELASISPVKDSTDNLTHFVAVKRDISHEVALESQLQQAQKMEAIGTLAGGIAHNFNNILGAIIGFTDISILQCDPKSPIYDNLLHIRNSGKRAADLVQQILTFSRQATSTDKMPVAVMALLKETLKLLRASLPTTIVIKLDIPETEGWILGDPVQIQQVIMNLCTNAYHAMSEKGGTLKIGFRKLPVAECLKIPGNGKKSCLELTISDTGHRIDQSILDRIFDPFFTTKEPGLGTGMGLSVVHGIIKDLEGIITVDSDSQGTCFTILLPEAERPEISEYAEEKDIPTGRESILVVDDEKDIRNTCQMMLKQLGYQVTTSAHPLEALTLIEEDGNKYDLLITDNTMPGLTGLELLEKVRQIRPDLPVILCIGFSEQINEELVLKKGARKLLLKPVNFRQIAESVREVLNGQVS